jgi:EAL domain-containing protein (putative c-di-GMP-specific phosphodiesterase class I)
VSSVEESPKSILIVEDDDSVARFFQRTLAAEHYRIHRARDGGEAMALIESRSFDTIVSDIGMPGLDGMQLLKGVRERDADVPVVIVTGKPEVASAVTSVEYGALRYLVKPITPRELKDAVATAIEAKATAVRNRRAVRALAEAKERTRLEKLTESHFSSALEGLYMDYQPIVEPRRAKIVGFEALVRTREATLSRPAELLAVAVELGMVGDLGRRVRESVASNAASLPKESLIFVNLHPYELLDEKLFSRANPLRADAGRVVFELVEQASLNSINEAVDRIEAIRSLGFRFAVDDLGAGYAALTNLVRFDPDFAKIDMTLVRDVDRLPAKRALIASLVKACSDLGTRLVCEGVETAREGHALLDLGVELLQGFYFARSRAVFDSIDRELLAKRVERFAESRQAPGGR